MQISNTISIVNLKQFLNLFMYLKINFLNAFLLSTEEGTICTRKTFPVSVEAPCKTDKFTQQKTHGKDDDDSYLLTL